MNNNEKRQRIENIVKVGGLMVIGFIVAPFVFIAIKGLIGLAIAALIGVTGIYMTPAIASMLANWRLKALKAEANRNPVETLQNDWNRQNQKVQSFRDSVVTFRGKIEVFAQKLRNFKHAEEKARFEAIHDKMRQLLGLRERALSTAQTNLVLYKEEIAKQGDLWEMGQAAEEMASYAGMSEEDVLAEIQKNTAFSAITNTLYASIAELDQSLLDEQNLAVQSGQHAAPAQLTSAKQSYIDVESSPVREPARVSR